MNGTRTKPRGASAATFADGYPKVCAGCGKPVVLARCDGVWFEWTPARGKATYHDGCRPKAAT